MIKSYLLLAPLIFISLSLKSQNLSVILKKNDITCFASNASIELVSGLNVSYLWSTGSTSNNINNLEVGDYSVKITSANQDTTIPFVIEDLMCEPIPENHFTPNGDDYNDTWSISLINLFPEFELFVYNRWGQIVHHQKNEYTEWDGKILGIPTPDASYYYILYLVKNDKKKIVKGVVSILR